jgi:hypothetical protein
VLPISSVAQQKLGRDTQTNNQARIILRLRPRRPESTPETRLRLPNNGTRSFASSPCCSIRKRIVATEGVSTADFTDFTDKESEQIRVIRVIRG